MSIEANKAQTMEIIDKGWNQGDMESLDALISPDYVNHTTHNAGEGRDGFKARVQTIRTAFPDWELIAEDMIGEGDDVVTRFRAGGTHRGRFAEIEPTGRRVEVMGIAIDRVRATANESGQTERGGRVRGRLHRGNAASGIGTPVCR